MMLSTFSCAYLYSLLKHCSILFLNWVEYFHIINFEKCYIFQVHTHYQACVLKIFSFSLCLVLSFFNNLFIFFNLCKKIDLAAYSSVNFNMFIDPCKNHNNQCMKSSCIESSFYSPYFLSNNSQKQLVYFPYLQLYHFWILCKYNPSAVTF